MTDAKTYCETELTQPLPERKPFKRCPFCGGDAWILQSCISDNKAVMCKSCRSSGGLRETDAAKDAEITRLTAECNELEKSLKRWKARYDAAIADRDELVPSYE